ncbi:hypothetical protein PYW08_001958 [Mythimna loreyi]|uniref:Uncharacterized protein n=1 Tax=Mythimna loreyi TaxID=667449 RepID=A0ACC2R0E2_9NEOP|nr:hypothetical protein PYW08_001958 [Mythimna loreyi]
MLSNKMSVDCQIIIQRANGGVFRPGEPVIGKVKYVINKPTKFKTIDINFLGKAKCAWSVPGPEKTTIEYFNEEEYVNDNINIFKSKHGQEDLLSGTFEYPYEFELPANIPSTIKFNLLCKIEYKVIVVFVLKSFWASVKKFSEEFPVYGFVSPCSPEPLIFSLQKKVISLKDISTVDVKAEIEKTFLAPGEDIILKLTINNDTDVPVTIKTELVEYCTCIANDKTNKVFTSPLTYTKSTRSVEKKSSSVITCIVPILLKWCSIQNSKILKGEFKVRVTAKLPFPYTNAFVEAPVVIGEMMTNHIEASKAVTDWNPSLSNTTTLC